MKKRKDLLIITLIYLGAYLVGWAASRDCRNPITEFLTFDVVSTVIVFAFSVLYRNSSVYDPYWSTTPMLFSVMMFSRHMPLSVWQLLFLLVFNLWSLRLTLNWCRVFTDFSYEDWRYRKYREENSPIMWQFLNFVGIHMVPTVVVFLGMLPLFEMMNTPMDTRMLPGAGVILLGVGLEFFADRQMHAFLESTRERTTCRRGLWSYSRHPNYLGEISVWWGMFFAMLPYAPEKWYYVVGAVSVTLLFNTVSIPMMEKRQMSRRPDYEAYRMETARLLPRFRRHS